MHVRKLSKVFLCVQRLEPMAAKKIVKKLEPWNLVFCKELCKSTCFFLTQFYNLLKIIFSKNQGQWAMKFLSLPKPRSWKLCIEGGPCELMCLGKQKAEKLQKTPWWIMVVVFFFTLLRFISNSGWLTCHISISSWLVNLKVSQHAENQHRSRTKEAQPRPFCTFQQPRVLCKSLIFAFTLTLLFSGKKAIRVL